MKNSSRLIKNLQPAEILSAFFRLIKKPSVCLIATRPKTLPASLAPVITGLSLASVIDEIHILTAVLTFISAAALQTAANLINDYMDFIKGHDTDRRLGPPRAVQSGTTDVYEIQLLIAAAAAVAAGSGLILVLNSGIIILAVGICSLTAAAAYSVFRKPLGFSGGGETAAFIFFGPVAVGGTFFIQTGFFSLETIFAGLSIGLYSLALLTVNNYRDMEEDRLTGKNSLPALFGRPAAIFCYSGVLAAPLAGPLFIVFQAGRNLLFLLPSAAVIPGIIIFIMFASSKPEKKLNRLLFLTSLTMIFHALLYYAAASLC